MAQLFYRRNITITNQTLTNADTEYSVALPTGCTYVAIKSRNNLVDIKFSFTSGESGITYLTIFGGTEWATHLDSIEVVTIYLQSSTAGVVVEFEQWT